MDVNTIVTGTPAAHASHLAGKAAKDIAVGWSGCAIAAIAAYLLISNPAAAALCVAAALGCGWWGQTRWVDYAKATAGARSERRVAKILDRCGAAAVAHGLLIGAGGDADHIVAGPCLAVIETKTGTGAVTVLDKGLKVGGRVMRGDPPGQARRQAAKIAKVTGIRCEAIVCIPDATGHPVMAGNVTVCNLKQVADVLATLPNVCDDASAHLIIAKFAALTRAPSAT